MRDIAAYSYIDLCILKVYKTYLQRKQNQHFLSAIFKIEVSHEPFKLQTPI